MIRQTSKSYHFLEGGGELGELIRSFDWSSTPVGTFDKWPQSLRTTVSIILHSDFPMFLWWGPEMIQFYNDAYRPSLGKNGKHPNAVGQRAEECWPEIWDIIYPLIQKVKETGESFFSEDQLIPIYRNGKVEDVYWTFSYSAVIGENGSIDGVLVVCTETTKNVRALNEIRRTEKLYMESENNLRNMIRQSPAAMCILKGPQHIIEVANTRMYEIWGRPEGQIQGRPFFEGIPEARGQGFEEKLNEVLTTGKTFTAHSVPVILPRDGNAETVYVNFVYEPFYENAGKISGVMAVAFEVTEIVQAQRQLSESEQKYKMLITESPIAMGLYLGPQLKIQYVNRIMTDYWGKDMSVVGLPIEEAVPELQGQPFPDLLRKVLSTGEAHIGKAEKAILKVDGRLQEFYFDYTYKPLIDADGKTYGIHHTALDVTDNVRSRQQRIRSEENLRNIILRAPVAMTILKGSDMVVQIANEKILEIWGKKIEEVRDKPIFEGLPEARSQGLEDILNHVFTTGEPYMAKELPIRLPKGGKLETKYLDFVYQALVEPEGPISGIMAVAIEVTDQVLARHQIEEVVAERTKELAELNRNLRGSNDQLAQFAYIASHDLQEPARKIKTFADMLRRNLGNIDTRAANYLEKIDNSASRMLTLIRDVLAFSQLSKPLQESVAIDLNRVLDSVIDDFELLIQEKGAIITSDPLPAILGIPIQISQLFNNLVSNSLKYTSDDRQPEIKIRVSALNRDEIEQNPALSADQQYYKISFIDNGIGFHQDNAAQIFDIFQRLHPRNEYQGTGIGLAMCRKICQNHNGDIYAEAAPGNGAAFHVILPTHDSTS